MVSHSGLVRCRWAKLATLLTMLLGGTATAIGARPPAYRLLPDTTIALVSITDASELAQRYMNTSLGRMSQDPQLKPLLEQLYGAVVDATSALEDRLGFSLSELLAIPQGELAAALVARQGAEPALVVLLDAGDQMPNARKLLQRAAEEMVGSGATISEVAIGDSNFLIFNNVGERRRKIVCFEKETTIAIGTDLKVLAQVLSLWNGGQGPTLADNPSFVDIMRRCGGAKKERPHLLWYADPIEIVSNVNQGNDRGGMFLTMLPALGLDGLKGVGGSMIYDTAQFDSVMHLHVLLEGPRTGALEMIALKSGDVEPEAWVPADVASYTTVHWDVERTYTRLAMLYDGFRGPGALAEVLKQRIFGPSGIDFEKEIIPSLESRVSLITRLSPQAAGQSRRRLVGLKLKDAATVETALAKLAQSDDARLQRAALAGRNYYRVRTPGLEEMPPGREPLQSCFGVLGDYLLAANSPRLYEEAITTAAGGADSLADQLDFKLIASRIRRQPGGDRPSLVGFNRPEESMRFIYEMLSSETTRQQLRAGADNVPLLGAVYKALEDHPLPPFFEVQKYLAPGGSMVVDDESGIHYATFSLRRKTR